MESNTVLYIISYGLVILFSHICYELFFITRSPNTLLLSAIRIIDSIITGIGRRNFPMIPFLNSLYSLFLSFNIEKTLCLRPIIKIKHTLNR